MIKIKGNKFLWSVLTFSLLLLISPLISSGLTATNFISINKTFEQPQTVSFTITNTESFIFYNTSIEDNLYINFPKIAQINPGEIYQIIANVTANEDFSGNLNIVGYYESNVGKNYDVYNIAIIYPDGSDVCDIDIVEGDTIIWNNNVVDDIEINGNYVLFENNIIPEGESKSHQFNNPEEFSYYLRRGGLQFGDFCTINVADDYGYIYNSNYDAEIFFEINIIYPETDISVNLPELNYYLEVYESGEGILSITNNGTQIAKNIHLSGDWMTFSSNDFDIEVGKTKGVLYQVMPIVYTTNATNKTYVKNLKIEGNFLTINKDINIFVEHAEIIDNNENITTGQDFLEFVQEFCEDNPEVCGGTKQIFIVNNSDEEFNVTFGSEQVYGIFSKMYSSFDDEEEWRNHLKEWMNNQEGVNNKTYELDNKLDNTNENMAIISNTLICFMIFVITSLVCLGIFIKGKYLKKQNKFLSFLKNGKK